MPVLEDLIRKAMPSPLRQPFEEWLTLVHIGELRNPATLLRRWLHRREFAELQRALMYHRYTTAVLQAHELGLFDALQAGPLGTEALAGRTGIRPHAAEAMLRILTAQGFVRRRRGKWALTLFARDFLAPEGPLSLSPLLGLLSAQAGAFDAALSGMRDGLPPAALDIFSEDSRYLAFLEAVNAYLNFAARDLLAQVRLPRVRQAIVGSMGVSFSAALLERFPKARVTYGCLPHLVREVPRLTQYYGIPEQAVTGIHSHGGDPSADRWGDENFDLVFLTKKMILAPEERMGEKFAAKAFEVLRPGGAAIFWETVYADHRPTPRDRALEGVLDLTAAPAGNVNTERGIRRMLENIGYRRVRIVPAMGGQTTFVLGYRPG